MSTTIGASQPLQYTQYIETISRTRPQYRPLLKWLRRQSPIGGRSDNPFVYIADSVNSSLRISKYLGQGRTASQDLETLKLALQNDGQDAEIQTRIILVDIHKQHLAPELVDMIGMQYDIEPAYFVGIAAKHTHPAQNPPGRDQVIEVEERGKGFLYLDLEKTPPFLDHHAHFWVKFLKGEGGNVVLIFMSAAPSSLRTLCESSPPGPKSSQTQHYQPPTIKTLTQSRAPDGFSGPIVLEALLSLSKQQIQSADKTPLEYLVRIIQGVLPMHFSTLRDLHVRHEEWLVTEREYREHDRDILFWKAWQEARISIENTDVALTSLESYITSNPRPNAEESPVLDSLMDEMRTWISRARKLEGHVRDELSLHVGWLSLEESRKSIEASQQSIAQAYSVRRLTVMAYLYLPFGLMTSAFGMNLKELGQNGPDLKIFFATTIALAGGSLLAWGLWVGARLVGKIDGVLREGWERASRDPEFGRRPRGWRGGVRRREYWKWGDVWREVKRDFRPEGEGSGSGSGGKSLVGGEAGMGA